MLITTKSSVEINGGTDVLIPPVNNAGLYEDAAVCPFTTASVSSTFKVTLSGSSRPTTDPS